MADSDKNILITPNRGQSSEPKIEFVGSSSLPITLKVLDDNSLSWEGSEGQLFSITNNLSSGTIFSVNDISGVPSIEVDANGTVVLAEFSGNVGVGTASPTYKFEVSGTLSSSVGLFTSITGSLQGNATTVTNGIYTTNISSYATTAVTAGTGLSGGGTVGALTLNLDFSELTDKTTDIAGTTEFILQDGTTESRKAASEIKLSVFNNDSGWTSNTGTVTSIATNNGVTGGTITTTGTIGLTGQALALHNLATNGLITRTGAGTVTGRTIAGGTGITVTNGDGVSGNPSIALTNNSLTVGSTSISLGGTATTIAGLTSVTSTGFTGSLNGNASTATTATQVSQTLTRGSYLTGNNYNGSSATTWAVDATSANTVSKVVARDASGNFSAGTITANQINLGNVNIYLSDDGFFQNNNSNVPVYIAGAGDVFINIDSNNNDADTKVFAVKKNALTTGGSELFRVQENGKIGIGVSTPDSLLHVHNGSAGTVTAPTDTVLTIENNTTNLVSLLCPDDSVSGVVFSFPSSNNAGGIYYYGPNDLNGERLNIDFASSTRISIAGGSGNVGIGTGPGTDKLRVGGNIAFASAGQGINFGADGNAAGMTSELLDDYEEGTWTASISPTTGMSYSNQTGFYVKVGNLVYATCRIDIATTGTDSTTGVTVTGLPFTSLNVNFFRTAGSMQIEGLSSGIVSSEVILSQNSSSISLLKRTAAATSYTTFKQTDFTTNTFIILSITYRVA